ncbi:MAG: hypothetical protein IPL47_12515 [Phyllobacteriaceae bacterium]|nr:hypothetical protein [Phyllobacteriaceae bacterium]
MRAATPIAIRVRLSSRRNSQTSEGQPPPKRAGDAEGNEADGQFDGEGSGAKQRGAAIDRAGDARATAQGVGPLFPVLKIRARSTT